MMVYVFLADGFEEVEGLTVVDLLRRAKIPTTMVSVTGNKMILGAHKIRVEADILFEETDYTDGEMLVLPGGGAGTRCLAAHRGLANLLQEYAAQGKYLTAICAAPSVLGELGLLEGKNAVCFPGFEDALKGATVVDAPYVKDGKFITGKGMGTAFQFGLAIVEALTDEQTAEHIAGITQFC